MPANPTEETMVLAAHIARSIFECPAGVGSTDVKRIAFKGAERRGGKEMDLGGLNEEALTRVIKAAIEDRNRE